MAVVQLDYYSNINTSIEDLQNTVDGVLTGHHNVTLTNYNNTSLPAIAIGSIVENNGTLFKFTTETAISGSSSDGTVYIYLVPSGDPTLGTATVTPTFNNTAPVWSDSKKGWYGTSIFSNWRCLEFKMEKSGTSYKYKRLGLSEDARAIPFENNIFLSTPVPSGSYTFTTAKGVYIDLTFTADYDIYSQYSAGSITIIDTGYYEIDFRLFNSLSILTSSFTGYLWSIIWPRIIKNSSTLDTIPFSYVSAMADSSNTLFSPHASFKKIYSFTKGDIISFQSQYDAGFTNTISTSFSYNSDSSVSIKKING